MAAAVIRCAGWFLVGACSCGVAAGAPVAFVYQGQLVKDGAPLTGSADLAFSLYDVASGGAEVGDTCTVSAVNVIDGLITVDVTFSDQDFTGDQRWLEVSVRSPAGSGAFATLAPRQLLGVAPYALSLRHVRTQDNDTSANIIAGHAGNEIRSGVVGAVIAGGGRMGLANFVTDHYGVVGGGMDNVAGDGTVSMEDADYATVSGGVSNRASGSWSTAGGGQSNTASGNRSAVGGGSFNTASSGYSLVAGGWENTASEWAASVLGGYANRAAGQYSSVGGGRGNEATGFCATVPGGRDNQAVGEISLAAGRSARALHDGAFVWADSQSAVFASTADDQFLIRATGGVGIGTTEPDAALHVLKSGLGVGAVVGESDGAVGRLGEETIGAVGAHIGSGNEGQLGTPSAGVAGYAGEDANCVGVAGSSVIGAGVGGVSIEAPGVRGFSVNDAGVEGSGLSLGVAGRSTQATGETYGVSGSAQSSSGYGVRGASAYTGVFGSGGTGAGVHGEAATVGVYGFATQTSGQVQGVKGEAMGTEGVGVRGHGSGGGEGVYGSAASGGGVGVRGFSLEGVGVHGATDADNQPGVYGRGSDVGVYGETTSAFGEAGVFGKTASGVGAGVSGEHVGAEDDAPGVYGVHTVSDGWGVGVHGYARHIGVLGRVDGGTSTRFPYCGVEGRAEGGVRDNRGVYGYAEGSTQYNVGVFGSAGQGAAFDYGVYAVGEGPFPQDAAYIDGDAVVAGMLLKGGGGFKIDHPLDPANKYLYHSFVESPDMKNVYDGNVTTDDAGEAVVSLPDWFEAVNRDYRYQLTVIGDFAQAVVSKEMEDSRFTIKTDRPNVKVSWQVTGIRKDPFAEAYRLGVEVDKPKQERGRYLHPEARGLPADVRLHHELSQRGHESKTEHRDTDDAARTCAAVGKEG